jgi:hypothetical protein
MRKKHGFTQKYPDVQASTATMNKHWYSRCHYKRNSGSTPAGMNYLHIGVARRRPLHQQRGNDLRLGRQDSNSDGPRANATAGRPSFTSPRGGREPAIKAKEPEARSAGGTDGVVGGETFFGCHHLSTDDGSHLPTNTAPASGGHPQAYRQVLTLVLATRTRTGPSQNTSTALTAYDVLCSRWRKEGLDVAGPHTAQPTPVRRTGSHAPPQRWEVAPEAVPEPLRPESQTRGSCQLPGRRTPLSPDR